MLPELQLYTSDAHEEEAEMQIVQSSPAGGLGVAQSPQGVNICPPSPILLAADVPRVSRMPAPPSLLLPAPAPGSGVPEPTALGEPTAWCSGGEGSHRAAVEGRNE